MSLASAPCSRSVTAAAVAAYPPASVTGTASNVICLRPVPVRSVSACNSTFNRLKASGLSDSAFSPVRCAASIVSNATLTAVGDSP